MRLTGVLSCRRMPLGYLALLILSRGLLRSTTYSPICIARVVCGLPRILCLLAILSVLALLLLLLLPAILSLLSVWRIGVVVALVRLLPIVSTLLV